MKRRKTERRSTNYRIMGPGETERRSGKDQRSGFWDTNKQPEKTDSILGNDRFWEYVAQIRIDGADPADILEVWLKEHNPEFLEND